MISEQAIKEYVDNKGEKCPFCKVGVVGTVGDIEFVNEEDPSILEQKVRCLDLDCGKSWTDIYQLVSIRV